ncbi:hypothetical protein Avi_4326 [Allorhizobium ampelinum S4]|uniref:Uncharacterized protein n=1 Tax=Allorhizobium ampelinum (strain ATCC BAA-846 / DSM 112012 / S4) TaxID=311402 RepID=B9JV01_ALLAM|nr:hypothetical protein Avi_4326 [Allorhizobium ampelinum S4]
MHCAGLRMAVVENAVDFVKGLDEDIGERIDFLAQNQSRQVGGFDGRFRFKIVRHRPILFPRDHPGFLLAATNVLMTRKDAATLSFSKEFDQAGQGRQSNCRIKA